MFSPSLLTIGSLAVQLRTLLKRPADESRANADVLERSVPENNRPEKFSLIKRPHSVRTFPALDLQIHPVSMPAVPPEIVATISATLAESCGTYVPIRSVKKLAPQSLAVTAWAHQGRARVQESHNLLRVNRQINGIDVAA